MFHFRGKEADFIAKFTKRTNKKKPDTSGQVGPKPAGRKRADHDPEKAGPSSRLHFEDEAEPETTSGQLGPKSSKGGKFRQDKDRERPSERLRREGEPPPGEAETGSGPNTKEARKTEKAKARAEKAGDKLGKARSKLDAQKPPKEPGIPRRLARSARS